MAMTEPVDAAGPDGNAGDDQPGRSDTRANGGAETRHGGTAYEVARERTDAIYKSARDRAANALESTRESAARMKAKAADGLDSNPIAAVFGGLAIGAVVAALLPRTRQENAALGRIGGKLNDGARNAAEAARNAGREKLDELGLSSDGLRERFGAFSKSAGDALRSTASAAVGSVRNKDRK